jgi:hypothetical protein
MINPPTKRGMKASLFDQLPKRSINNISLLFISKSKHIVLYLHYENEES